MEMNGNLKIMSIVNFEEYKLGKRVMDDFPGCIESINKCMLELAKYEEYYEIAMCIQKLFESKVLMLITLEAYAELMKQNEAKNEEKD